MSDENTNLNPENTGSIDPNQGQSQAPAPNQSVEPVAPAQAALNPDTQGKEGDPEKGKKPDSSQTVPVDRFKDVYRRMKEAERKLEEKERAQGPAPAASSPSPTSARQGAPKWAEYEAAGKTAEEFNAAWIAHEVKANLEASREADRMKADDDAHLERESKAMANLQKSAAVTAKKYPDYMEKLKAASDLGIQFHPAVELAISESDNPGEIGYHLAKDTDKAFELMTLPVDKALIRLGQYIAKMPSSASAPAAVTNANPPPTPLNGGGKAPLTYVPGMPDADFDRLFPPD